MVTTNLSTLKIHKLSKSQYERELAKGTLEENALYLTPDESSTPITYGTDGLTAGSSYLASGTVYYQYE